MFHHDLIFFFLYFTYYLLDQQYVLSVMFPAKSRSMYLIQLTLDVRRSQIFSPYPPLDLWPCRHVTLL
jgi:hypothetical protein